MPYVICYIITVCYIREIQQETQLNYAMRDSLLVCQENVSLENGNVMVIMIVLLLMMRLIVVRVCVGVCTCVCVDQCQNYALMMIALVTLHDCQYIIVMTHHY